MSSAQQVTGRRRVVPVSLGARSYNILIQAGVLRDVGACLGDAGLAGRVAVVTNPVVRQRYGRTVERSLKRAGYRPLVIEVPDGERAKTFSWVSKVVDVLVAARFERSDIVMALGGGVVGDLAGFAAAVYLRGIPFVQVATTLVAQVDSSVGGKTGVNHRAGKNLIGAFYQPRLVVMDTESLRTLPVREWTAGLAEVIKYGMIADPTFFTYLEERMPALLAMETSVVQYVVQRCCEIKAAVVAEDERESGLRRILNYGHTIGHGLESLSRYRKFLHGEAVGIGMVQEAALAVFLELCSSEVARRQRDLVRAAGLRSTLPAVTFSQLWAAMQHDKKVARGDIHCVLPTAVGQVAVVPLERAAVKRWLAQVH